MSILAGARPHVIIAGLSAYESLSVMIGYAAAYIHAAEMCNDARDLEADGWDLAEHFADGSAGVTTPAR
jgi:hypothetical protein